MWRALLEIARAIVAYLERGRVAKVTKDREERNAAIYDDPGAIADDFFNGMRDSKTTGTKSTAAGTKADSDSASK